MDLDRPRLSHRVRAEVRHVNVGALDIVLSPFWAVGWVVFWVLLGLGAAVRLGEAAVRLGWMDARDTAQSRQIAVDRWPVKPRSPRQKAAAGGPR